MPPQVKKIRKKKRRPADRDSSGVEDEDKTPLPVVEEADKASPKASTKASPKGKPRSSPKPSVPVSPKSEPSKEKESKEEDKEYKELSKEAIQLIETEISKPDAQQGGKAFIPPNWSIKFKKVLGPYRKFLNKNSTKFATYTAENDNFIIVKAGSPPPACHVPNQPWKNKLLKAWMEYCRVVPKDERDFKAFCAAIPMQAASQKSPKATPHAAPGSPKSAPDKTVKKKKVKKVITKKK